MINVFFDMVILIILLIGAYYDKTKLIIPDTVSISVSVTALTKAIINDTLAATVFVGIGFLLFLLFLSIKADSLGGGDIKLLSATAAYFGFIQALFLTGIACIIALIRFKKQNIKSTYLAPFIFVGASVMCFFNYI